MVAVRGLADGGVVVAHVFPHGETGAVGQNYVVFGEAFLGGGGGGHHHHEAGPELEREDWAELGGERV